jgi:hypothetical protein
MSARTGMMKPRGAPEVVPALEALEARAEPERGHAKVRAELEHLRRAAVAVAEVRLHRVALVLAEALDREAERLCVVREAGVREHGRVAVARDDELRGRQR